jgi:hypothetical protein
MQAAIAYLALEVLLATVASVESLTDAVTGSSGIGRSISRSTGAVQAEANQLLLAPLAAPGAGSPGPQQRAGLAQGSPSRRSSTPAQQQQSPLSAGAAAAVGLTLRTATPGSSPGGSSANLAAVAAAAVGGGGTSTTSSSTAPFRQPSLAAPAPAAQRCSVPPLTADAVSQLVDKLWRSLLVGLGCALGRVRSRPSHEALLLALLRGLQSYVFSAGVLGEGAARDGFLRVLCEAAVTPAGAEEAAAAAAAAAGGGSSSSHGEAAQVGWPRLCVGVGVCAPSPA